MTKSNDISEEYEKLLAKGLSRFAEKKKEKTLYNVKPDSQKYEKNIMEIAHPNQVILTKSYDPINSLIENEIERQNITVNIINKKPTGQAINKKYAENELLLSLIKTANYLESKNDDSLISHADKCISQLQKEAVAPAAAAAAPAVAIGAIPIIIGVGAVIGLLYWQQHSSSANLGFQKNFDKLNSEIDDLLTSGSSGIGTTYKDGFKTELIKFKSNLEKLNVLNKKFDGLVRKIQVPKTAEELADVAESITVKEAQIAFDEFYKVFQNVKPYLQTVKSSFTDKTFKSQQVKEEGIGSSIVNWLDTNLGGSLHGGSGLIKDNFDDVVKLIDPFMKSCEELMEILHRTEAAKVEAVQKAKTLMPEESAKPKATDQDPSISDDLDSHLSKFFPK